ncbi:hypothetical protein BDV06DRAFT_219289 [Aspergillus oleicola]
MHLTTHLKTLTFLGTLAACHSPSAAEKSDQKAQLGYLKCVSAVVKTTSFPSCTSSYKLDCFCEAQAQTQAREPRYENSLPLPSSSASASAARIQLEPEVEDLCAENGVPKEDIARYLCDDDVVPASPRRGSTPIVRLGKSSASGNDSRIQERQVDERLQGEEHASKRSIDPSKTRLLIPENDPNPAPEPDANNDSQSQDSATADEGSRVASVDTNMEEAERLTQTVTETVCSCESEKTADAESPSSPTSEAPEGPTSIETHPVHGTEIAVAILSSTAALPTPTSTITDTKKDGYAKSSSSVRLSSSSVVVSEPVPTGVDGQTIEHGVNHEEPGSRGASASDSSDVFEGGAMVNSVYVSRAVIVGVLGVVGAGVWV